MTITRVGTPNGTTGTGSGESVTFTVASGSHYFIVSSAAEGTTAVSSISVGSLTAARLTGGTKTDAGSNTTNEVWAVQGDAGTNPSVTVTYAASVRHAWSAIAYDGVFSTAPTEGLLTTSGSGASPQTASIAMASGKAGSWIIQSAAFNDTSNGSGSITGSVGASQSKQDEHDLAGATHSKSDTEVISDYANSTAQTVTTTGTKSGRTIAYASIAFRIDPTSFSLSDTDTGSGSDQFNKITRTLLESGSNSDVLKSIEKILPETGSGADNLNTTTRTLPTESATGTDKLQTVTRTLPETSSGVEGKTLNKTPILQADTGSGSDSFKQITRTILESSSGSDTLRQLTRTISESSIGADMINRLTRILPESGTGLDVLFQIQRDESDSSSGSDKVVTVTRNSIADSGTGTELLHQISRTIQESSIGTDALVRLTRILIETAVTLDVLNTIKRIVVETASGVETWIVTAKIFDTDSAIGIDTVITLQRILSEAAIAADIGSVTTSGGGGGTIVRMISFQGFFGTKSQSMSLRLAAPSADVQKVILPGKSFLSRIPVLGKIVSVAKQFINKLRGK